jgi:hypothetical protein
VTIPDPIAGKALEKAVESAASLAPEMYHDALQPATKEVGSALGRTVRMALAPIRAMAWTWEHAESWLESAITERLARRGIPQERIMTPRPQIAAGVTRGVQAAGPEADPTLRNMFASLLANAMDSEKESQAHPAFAEILAQVTPTEARLLGELAKRFPSPVIVSITVGWIDGVLPERRETIAQAKVVAAELGILGDEDVLEAMLDNLQRLGLVRLVSETYEQKHQQAIADGDQEYDTAQKERWSSFKDYLEGYGQDAALRMLRVFQEQPLAEVSHLRAMALAGSRRVAIHLRLLWPNTFGTQLLRTVTEPEVFGSEQDGRPSPAPAPLDLDHGTVT